MKRRHLLFPLPLLALGLLASWQIRRPNLSHATPQKGAPSQSSPVASHTASPVQDEVSTKLRLSDPTTFAQHHRREMARLIQSDPAAALKAALTPEQRASLPVEILKNLEQPVSGVGLLAKLVSCDEHDEATYSHDAM